MPPTEQSIISKQVYINKTNIENLEKAVNEIKDSVKELTNHFSNRLPWFFTLIISTLVGMVSMLATYIIMH